MKPKMVKKEALLIAGISGAGDETAKAWDAFRKLDELNPLKNKAGEGRYEIRMYPAEGPGEVHVGMPVKDTNVPAEYKVVAMPASLYADFEIYPARGYESSNTAMDKWLYENAATYKEVLFNGKHYAIEVYDNRYKGDKDPNSVVGILVPIAPVGAENPLIKMVADAVKEFSQRIEQYAGVEIRKKVMRGGEEMQGILDPVKGALDYKDAIDRLNKLVDAQTCNKIMSACGCACQSIYDQSALKAKETRQQYTTEEEFLANFEVFDNGTQIERKGKDLIQHFSPAKLFPNIPGIRCACMLIGGLPEGTNASPTVCECSRAFTEKRWETILGRPVKAEVVSTPIINGGDECVFIIHL